MLASANTANPCTIFFLLHNGQMVFGRNCYPVADAEMVCTNQQGLTKISVKNPDDNTINWVSLCALLLLILWKRISCRRYEWKRNGSGTDAAGWNSIPQPEERPFVGALQWLQYQLDNYFTIEVLIASDKTIRIPSKGTPLHYLVAEVNGDAASIEFPDVKMIVDKSDDLPMPVLINNT